MIGAHVLEQAGDSGFGLRVLAVEGSKGQIYEYCIEGYGHLLKKLTPVEHQELLLRIERTARSYLNGLVV